MACDVSDRGALEELLCQATAHERPLDAVFHVAGAIDDGLLDALTLERLERVLAAKAQGALHLHELTAHLPLSAFVMFSSVAGALGAGGQGNYAAANAFLDCLAEHRRAQGLPATSVAWGLWAGAGMGAGVDERLRRRGVRGMSAEPALAALRQALDREETCLTVADLEWERYAPTFSSAGAHPLIGDLPEVRQAPRGEPAGREKVTGSGALVERLAGVAEAERRGAVLEAVCSEAASVLGHTSVEDVPVRRSFKELGFDSLAGIDLCNRLMAATGLRLPSTLTFDHPTPEALAGHLLTLLAGERAEPGASPGVSVSVTAADEPVAIVGIGCRYPGSVSSPEGLWELVDGGGDAIGGFPADRGWDLAGLYDPDPDRPGCTNAREGGFLHDAGEFDAAFFGISPREALAMDPQQRLLLEVCWEALEDAGIDPSSLRGTRTGAFVGIGDSRYGARPLSEEGEGYWLTGNAASVASGRVAYVFGLEGPAVSVDTACSSSLVALHWACGALRGGECSLALAGGVAVMATPDQFVEFSRQRGLAADGRCRSFADSADGTGWSEGAGVLVLERLCDARRDGHRVLGLVRGSAVNQDGASNGLTAPNGPAQQRVIVQALANAGLEPGEVDVVEGHGTGTTLGDPIEAQALLATYGQAHVRADPLWLGSVKSNIGHAAAAAGVAGVIKMVMALRHELLPATLHVDEPSTRVDWGSGAVSLLTEALPWKPAGRLRRAGISSFGVSGTNAHVILEEAPPQEPPSARAGAGADAGMGAGAEAGVEESSGMGMGAGAEAGVEESSGMGAGAEAGVEESSGMGMGAGAEAGVEESSGMGMGAGAEAGVDADVNVAVLRGGSLPWVVSARGGDALRAQAERLCAHVAGDAELDPLDVGLSLAHRRCSRSAPWCSAPSTGCSPGCERCLLASGPPTSSLARPPRAMTGSSCCFRARARSGQA